MYYFFAVLHPLLVLLIAGSASAAEHSLRTYPKRLSLRDPSVTEKEKGTLFELALRRALTLPDPIKERALNYEKQIRRAGSIRLTVIALYCFWAVGPLFSGFHPGELREGYVLPSFVLGVLCLLPALARFTELRVVSLSGEPPSPRRTVRAVLFALTNLFSPSSPGVEYDAEHKLALGAPGDELLDTYLFTLKKRFRATALLAVGCFLDAGLVLYWASLELRP